MSTERTAPEIEGLKMSDVQSTPSPSGRQITPGSYNLTLKRPLPLPDQSAFTKPHILFDMNVRSTITANRRFLNGENSREVVTVLCLRNREVASATWGRLPDEMVGLIFEFTFFPTTKKEVVHETNFTRRPWDGVLYCGGYTPVVVARMVKRAVIQEE